ncbi:MAG: hypothetical protein ACKOSO_00235 [Actinomycetota bacterium]
MAPRRIPIPFLAAALALALLPPLATAWAATLHDPAPAAAPADDDAIEVTVEVEPLEPLGGTTSETPAATAEASASAVDAIATLPPGIPLPAGTPQTALVAGEPGARTWTLVYPGADRAAYDAWLAELLATGLASTFTLEQGDLRSETLAGDGFTAQAQYVEGVGVALTVQEG